MDHNDQSNPDNPSTKSTTSTRSTKETPTQTDQGTPCSPKWDPDWIAEVDYTERQLGHRICGAHTPINTPCKLTSTHKNGRCRFHGGIDNIGELSVTNRAWRKHSMVDCATRTSQ